MAKEQPALFSAMKAIREGAEIKLPHLSTVLSEYFAREALKERPDRMDLAFHRHAEAVSEPRRPRPQTVDEIIEAYSWFLR
jgi:hypothetical protein